MKSFSDYMQNKNLESLMSEVAHKMVEVNVDPWDFLMDYYKEDSNMVIVLEAHKEETLNEFLGGLKRFGSTLLKGAQQFGQGLGAAAQAVGGSAAETAKQIRAGLAGPEAHYAASIEALQGLSRELNKNKEVQAAMQSSDPQTQANYKKIVGDLQGILKQLDQQKQQVSAFLTRQAGTTTSTTTPGGLDASSQVKVPGATPAGTQQQPQQQPQTQQFIPSGKIWTPASYGN